MGGIVCSIRGGAASQPTIDQAIHTAKETGLPISFLYIINLDFLMHTAHMRTQTIAEELRKLGEFVLLVAQSKAEAGGVVASGVIREGDVGDEIVALCQELQADYVILGRPVSEHGENVFSHDRISAFQQRLEQETAAQVVLADIGAP